MEYIPINEAKLKVILESADLVRWDIRAEDLDYSNPEAKFVFEDILQHAKDAFGFDTSGYKILLQLFPSKDGSCELFITRLSARSSGISSEALLRPSESAAYSFERLSHLISVCKRLIDAGFCGESSAWTDELGKWYLLLSESDMLSLNGLPVLGDVSFIEEYGDVQSPRALYLYLGEYAQSICKERAVETLSKI